MLKFPMVFWAFQRYFSSRGILVNLKALWRYFDHFKGFMGILVILEFPCGILLTLGIYRVFWLFWMRWKTLLLFFWQKIIYAHHNCIFLVNRRYF